MGKDWASHPLCNGFHKPQFEGWGYVAGEGSNTQGLVNGLESGLLLQILPNPGQKPRGQLSCCLPLALHMGLGLSDVPEEFLECGGLVIEQR